MTTLPRDQDNMPIPALRLNPNGAHELNATAVPTRNSVAFDNKTRVISVYATGDVRIKFGDDVITAIASDHYYPSGVYYDFAIGGGKVVHTPYISVLANGTDCTVYISEKE